MIIKWLQKLKEAEAQSRREEGFGFAMYQFFVEGKTVDDIGNYTHEARVFGSYNDFDRGIDEALRHLYDVEANDEALRLEDECHDFSC